MIILISLRWWDNHKWEEKWEVSYKLGWSLLCTRKSWIASALLMKDNCADKVCSKLIASLDLGAAPCNKQPHSCHSIQSTDYKTWTSFDRSIQADSLLLVLLSWTGTPSHLSPPFKSLLKTDRGDVTTSEGGAPVSFRQPLQGSSSLLPEWGQEAGRVQVTVIRENLKIKMPSPRTGMCLQTPRAPSLGSKPPWAAPTSVRSWRPRSRVWGLTCMSTEWIGVMWSLSGVPPKDRARRA